MKQNKEIEQQKAKDVIPEEEEEIDEYPIYEDDVEIWQDYMSEELATAYHILVDWFQGQGLPILENCTFGDFAEFCYVHSSGRKPVC
jgi:hypothetical protein